MNAISIHANWTPFIANMTENNEHGGTISSARGHLLWEFLQMKMTKGVANVDTEQWSALLCYGEL
jgi:hypothetical protein